MEPILFCAPWKVNRRVFAQARSILDRLETQVQVLVIPIVKNSFTVTKSRSSRVLPL